MRIGTATALLQALLFAAATLAAICLLVFAGLREESQQGRAARSACLERCPALVVSLLATGSPAP